MKAIIRFITYWCFAVVIFICLIPLFWISISSIKPSELIWKMPPVWVFQPTVDHWISVLDPIISNFPKFTLNSLIIAGASTLITLIIGIPAAYAFSRFRFRAQRFLFFWILTTRMAPPFCIVIPMFILWNKLGLIDTHICLIVMYIGFDLAFVVWLMKGFFDKVPKEVEENAQIDGSSLFQTMRKISLPLVKPGIVASAFISFLFNWNEFLMGVIFTREAAKTVQAGLVGFVGFSAISWGELAVGALIAAIPAMIIGLALQRHIVTGLTLGAIKE